MSTANAAPITSSLFCIYTNDTVQPAGAATISGTLVDIGTTRVLSISNIMSYDVPFSKCPAKLLDKSSTIKGMLADVGGVKYPIYAEAVNTANPLYTNLVKTYAAGILNTNIKNTLSGMVMSDKNFKQYQADYPRQSLTLVIKGKDVIYDDHGKSSIFNNGMPLTYDTAWLGLKNYLSNAAIPGLDAKGAEITSTFITRYFNQSGYFSIVDYLMGVGFNSYGTLLGGEAPHISTTITVNQQGDPVLTMAWVKHHTSLLQPNNNIIAINQDTNLQLSFVINKAQSSTQKLYVSTDTKDFVVAENNGKSTNTPDGKLISQSIFNSFIQNIALTSIKNPNTDQFSVK